MLDIGKVRGRWWVLVSCFVIALLSVDVILLTLQNKQLKKLLSITTPQGQLEALRPGERVEPFNIQALDGKTRELNYTDPNLKYLLFVLSTTCPHCEKTIANWNAITETNRKRTCYIVGVSIHNLEETIEYIAAKKVSFYMVSAATDTSFSRKYKIAGVPETILIKGDGSVQKVWSGELSEDQTKEIQELIGT